MESALRIYNKHNISELGSEERDFINRLDIYYQPEFLACDAHMQNGDYELAICTSGNHKWVYPYIVLPIKGTPYFDISSPYGYAGPVSSSKEIQPEAEKLFVEYIGAKKNIITEFVRYHHIYNEHHFFQINISNLLNRKVVVLETKDREEIWMNQFSGTNRNLVRKLEKEGFEWSIKPFEHEDIVDFNEAYKANMLHSGATNFYFFPHDFYAEMIERLGEKLLLAKVEKDSEVYASALFFVSGKMVTYYLSARNLNYPKVPGSNLLLSKMAFWAQENGMELLNFGGGLSLDENDFLFRFKSDFGKQIKNFTIGKRIHQPEIYKQLQQKFITENGEEAFQRVKHILQFYA